MKINSSLNAEAITKELASRLRQYRIALPMTRAELAERSMVSLGTIARFENGNDIGLINLVKLLNALGLDENLDLLIADPQERPSHFIETATPRKRARKRKTESNGWKWGDEE